MGFLDALKSFQRFCIGNWKTFVIALVDLLLYMKIISLLDVLRASKIQKVYTLEDTILWFSLTESNEESNDS